MGGRISGEGPERVVRFLFKWVEGAAIHLPETLEDVAVHVPLGVIG